QSNGRLEALRFGSDQEGIQRKLQTNSDRSPGKPFRRGHGSDDESRSASLLDQGRMRTLAEEDETALQSHSEGEGTCVEGMREEAEDRRLFRLDRQAEILGLRAKVENAGLEGEDRVVDSQTGAHPIRAAEIEDGCSENPQGLQGKGVSTLGPSLAHRLRVVDAPELVAVDCGRLPVDHADVAFEQMLSVSLKKTVSTGAERDADAGLVGHHLGHHRLARARVANDPGPGVG